MARTSENYEGQSCVMAAHRMMLNAPAGPPRGRSRNRLSASPHRHLAFQVSTSDTTTFVRSRSRSYSSAASPVAVSRKSDRRESCDKAAHIYWLGPRRLRGRRRWIAASAGCACQVRGSAARSSLPLVLALRSRSAAGFAARAWASQRSFTLQFLGQDGAFGSDGAMVTLW